MRVVIASDIHGSSVYAQRVTELAAKEQADFLVLLGDIYNHGPRNPLPEGYEPLKVAELLQGVKGLMVVRGNCDSEVDSMISDFTFSDDLFFTVAGRRVFCTHGHRYSTERLPQLSEGDIFVQGHTHLAFIERAESGVILANPGSVSLPKDGNRGVLILSEQEIRWQPLNGGEGFALPL